MHVPPTQHTGATKHHGAATTTLWRTPHAYFWSVLPALAISFEMKDISSFFCSESLKGSLKVRTLPLSSPTASKPRCLGLKTRLVTFCDPEPVSGKVRTGCCLLCNRS